MTKRPIFIVIATALALAVTAGLALGAGRLGTRGSGNRVGHTYVAAVQPGYFLGHGNVASRMGARHFTHRWMGPGLRSRGWNHAAFMGPRSVTRYRNTTAVPANGTSRRGHHRSYRHDGRHGGDCCCSWH